MDDTSAGGPISRRRFNRALAVAALAAGTAAFLHTRLSASGAISEQGGMIMTIETKKATVRRYFEEIVNGGSAAAVAELLTPDFQLQLGSNPPVGAAAVLPLRESYLSAFPDYRDEVTDMIGEGDRVVAWGVTRATHRGEFMGIAATGKQIAVGWFSLFRFTPDGTIREVIVALDQLGMLQQLGALPVPAQPTV